MSTAMFCMHYSLLYLRSVLTDCPQVQVAHNYVAQQPDELNLETGDVVNVLRKTKDGKRKMMYLNYFSPTLTK